MAQGSAADRLMTVAVIGRDPAKVALVGVGLALVGAAQHAEVKDQAAAMRALAAGDLGHLVLIAQTLPAEVVTALREQPGLVRRITLLLAEGDEAPTRPAGVRALPATSPLSDIASAVLGGRALIPSGTDIYEADAGDLSVPELLGAALTLRPTMKLWFEREGGAVGLCLVDGRVRAIGRVGERILEQEALREDKSLELLLSLWADQAPAESAPAGLHMDLHFVCDYGDLFAASEPYAE